MTAQHGANVLLQVGNGGMPETFATLAGMRLTRLQFSNRAINADTLASGVWRTLLYGVGPRQLSIAVAGRFENSVAEDALRGYALAGNVRNYRVLFGNGAAISGPFLVTAYAREGRVDDAETYQITLESAGEVEYSAG